MWYHTSVTKKLGVEYPIFQGPFGGNLSTVKLAATVSNMGGVGGYGAYTLSPDEIFKVIGEIRQATDKPYNINLWVSDNDIPGEGIDETAFEKTKNLFRPYFEELGLDFPEKPSRSALRFENQVEVILDTRPAMFSFLFGIPSPFILEECRKRGIVTAGAATTLDEALALEAAGVDMIITSGFEAGGHRPSFLAAAESSLMGSFVLLQLVKDKVRTPVVAAGGIATGKGITAALALGADGVQIGTAFLACEESGAPDFHREMLFSEASKYSVLTRSFTGRLGRGMGNRITAAAIGHEKELLPFPLQTRFVSSLRQAAIAQQKWDLIFLWGGQIAPILKYKKAAELMSALVEEANDYFNVLKS